MTAHDIYTGTNVVFDYMTREKGVMWLYFASKQIIKLVKGAMTSSWVRRTTWFENGIKIKYTMIFATTIKLFEINLS